MFRNVLALALLAAAGLSPELAHTNDQATADDGVAASRQVDLSPREGG
ncbi:hypothetical protein AB4Y64_10075 [Lysobacter sp. TAF61]